VSQPCLALTSLTADKDNNWTDFCVSLQLASFTHSTTISPVQRLLFPDGHGLTGPECLHSGFIAVKDDGGGGDNRSYNTCKALVISVTKPVETTDGKRHKTFLSILTAIFPGGPGLAGTGMSPFWISLQLRMMEVVETTPGKVHAKCQLSRSSPSTLAPIKSRTETFWYRLTQVHPEKWSFKWGKLPCHFPSVLGRTNNFRETAVEEVRSGVITECSDLGSRCK